MTNGELYKCEIFVLRACKASLWNMPADPQREQFEAYLRDYPRFPWRREISKRVGQAGLIYFDLPDEVDS